MIVFCNRNTEAVEKEPFSLIEPEHLKYKKIACLSHFLLFSSD